MSHSNTLDDLFGSITPRQDGTEILAALRAAARERILVLDGAMGTQIQGLGFDEEAISAASASPAAPAISRATTTC